METIVTVLGILFIIFLFVCATIKLFNDYL